MNNDNWSPMYCVQLYKATESDNGLRRLIKDINTGKVYEEKIEFIKADTINNDVETINYYDRKPLN